MRYLYRMQTLRKILHSCSWLEKHPNRWCLDWKKRQNRTYRGWRSRSMCSTSLCHRWTAFYFWTPPPCFQPDAYPNPAWRQISWSPSRRCSTNRPRALLEDMHRPMRKNTNPTGFSLFRRTFSGDQKEGRRIRTLPEKQMLQRTFAQNFQPAHRPISIHRDQTQHCFQTFGTCLWPATCPSLKYLHWTKHDYQNRRKVFQPTRACLWPGSYPNTASPHTHLRNTFHFQHMLYHPSLGKFLLHCKNYHLLQVWATQEFYPRRCSPDHRQDKKTAEKMLQYLQINPRNQLLRNRPISRHLAWTNMLYKTCCSYFRL